MSFLKFGSFFGPFCENMVIFNLFRIPLEGGALYYVAKFLVPDLGGTVDSCIRFVIAACQAMYVHRMEVRYHNHPMPESTISTSQGLRVGPLLTQQSYGVSSDICHRQLHFSM